MVPLISLNGLVVINHLIPKGILLVQYLLMVWKPKQLWLDRLTVNELIWICSWYTSPFNWVFAYFLCSPFLLNSGYLSSVSSTPGSSHTWSWALSVNTQPQSVATPTFTACLHSACSSSLSSWVSSCRETTRGPSSAAAWHTVHQVKHVYLRKSFMRTVPILIIILTWYSGSLRRRDSSSLW